MVNTKLLFGLVGVWLMILSACTQQGQQRDIAGQAIVTLTPAQIQNTDCTKFALPAVECPVFTADRTGAGLSPTVANLVVINSQADSMDTDNDGNAFVDVSPVNGVDDDARFDDVLLKQINRDLSPRPLVTAYLDSEALPTLPAGNPTNVLGIELRATTTANPKEVVLANKVGWVFNRGANRWDAFEWNSAGPTAASFIGATAGNAWLKIAGPGVTPVTILPKSTTTVTPAYDFTLKQGAVRFSFVDDFLGRSVAGADGQQFARNSDYSLVSLMVCTCNDDLALTNTKPCNNQKKWDCKSDPNVGTPGGPVVNAKFTSVPFQIAEGVVGVSEVAPPPTLEP